MMSDKEILEKAVKLALKNGFNYLGYPDNGWGVGSGEWSTSDTHLCIVHSRYDQYIHYSEIIYNHSFAKALWGNTPFHDGSNNDKHLKHWAWQLQQMVISEDPIKYLGENI